MFESRFLNEREEQKSDRQENRRRREEVLYEDERSRSEFFPMKEKQAQRQTAFPDTLCDVVVATGCSIIRRCVASIGGSVFNSPGSMDVQPNEDEAVAWLPFWYVKKWTPWLLVWGRGGSVKEVRGSRQRLLPHCLSGHCASIWRRLVKSGLRAGQEWFLLC